MIRVNVGGTIFHTLTHTLSGAGGLLRSLVIHPEQFIKDQQGFPFLDRNPKHFEIILDLCRNNGRPIREKLPAYLMDDIDYLGITSTIPFKFERGQEIGYINENGYVRAWIHEITLHTVTIGIDEQRREYTHDIWDGEKWNIDQHNDSS